MKLVTTTRTKHYVKNFDYIRMTRGEKSRMGNVVRTFSPKTKEPIFIIEDVFGGHTTQIKSDEWKYEIQLNDLWHKAEFAWYDRDVKESNVLVYYKTKEDVKELNVGDVIPVHASTWESGKGDRVLSETTVNACIIALNNMQLVTVINGKYVVFDLRTFDYTHYKRSTTDGYYLRADCSLRA
ncbi:hypothetical protein phiGrn1_0284 [Vibrio phage phi-Grn1]|uniref:Uncharacterized protein n=1 Tax=Vibrio phage phi-Grn1 TaxID=1747713 RepID=A0A126HGU1_9CAUD|nr:hypothetical protein phiGrn1_0284 [Vibrio phage phi-Grn1]